MQLCKRTIHAAMGAGLVAALWSAPASAEIKEFGVNLQTLNAAFGSTAEGTGHLTLNTDGVNEDFTGGTATLRVELTATGLEDLSAISGALHVGHIHGQFAGNASRPLGEQGDGPFFEGEGGEPVDSVTPTAADDGGANIDETGEFGTSSDYLDFFEGRPDYGPVVLNLTSTQIEAAPNGTPPLNNFLALAADGSIDPASLFPNGTMFLLDTTYSFDLSDEDERRQFNNVAGPNGEQLTTREIVLHGLTIPRAISDAIDAAVGQNPGDPFAGVPLAGLDGILDTDDDLAFRVTAPVAAGTIQAVPLPSGVLMGASLLGGLGAFKRRRRCA